MQGKGYADSYGVALYSSPGSLVQIYTVLGFWAGNRCGLSCFFMHSRISIIELLVCVLGLYSLFHGSMIYVFSGTWTV